MEICCQALDKWTVLTVSGRVDAVTCSQLQKALEQAIGDRSCNIALELAQVDYLSSAGLRVLLIANKAARGKGGKVALINPHAFVKEVLDIANFTSLFTIVDNLECLG